MIFGSHDGPLGSKRIISALIQLAEIRGVWMVSK